MRIYFGFGWIHTPDVIASFTGGLIQKSWHLDLICKRDYLNNLYLGGAFSESGKNVAIYILSTGITFSSKTLKNRVFQLYGNEDIDGHGTALASIVAGVQYGIARSAHVYGLTLDYANLRTSLDAAITVVLNHIANGTNKAVVLLDALEVPEESNNFRFTSDSDNALTLSVQRLLDLNITTIACAKSGYYNKGNWLGNLNLDFLPPISTTDVMSFVGFDNRFIHYLYCNYGASAFLYAPCCMIVVESLQGILYYDSHADYASAIGTGIAALCLSKNPHWGHKQVKAFLKRICRTKKINNSRSYGYDAIVGMDRDFVLDKQGHIIVYTYPNFTMLTSDSVNAYFIKNLLEFNSDADLGEFNSNQTISISFDVICKSFYEENKPYLLKILSSDCAFLKIDSANKLYGFVPVHKTDISYSIILGISNGVNALSKTLIFKIKTTVTQSKVAAVKVIVKEKNWLDFNLVYKEHEKYNLVETQFHLKTSITRPVSREVGFYDHVSGHYSNSIKSSPNTGDAFVDTKSDRLYAIIAEDKKDRLISDSKIISRIDPQ
jgi:hypothetical protein